MFNANGLSEGRERSKPYPLKSTPGDVLGIGVRELAEKATNTLTLKVGVYDNK